MAAGLHLQMPDFTYVPLADTKLPRLRIITVIPGVFLQIGVTFIITAKQIAQRKPQRTGYSVERVNPGVRTPRLQLRQRSLGNAG